MFQLVYMSLLSLFFKSSIQAPDLIKGNRMIRGLGLSMKDNSAIVQIIAQSVPDLCRVQKDLNNFSRDLSDNGKRVLERVIKSFEQYMRMEALFATQKSLKPEMLKQNEQINKVLSNAFGVSLSLTGN